MKKNASNSTIPAISSINSLNLSSSLNFGSSIGKESRNFNLAYKKKNANANKIRRDEVFECCTFRVLIPNNIKLCKYPSQDEVDSFLANLETRNYVIQGETLTFFLVIEKQISEEDKVFEEYNKFIQEQKKLEEKEDFKGRSVKQILPKSDFYNCFEHCLLATDFLEKQNTAFKLTSTNLSKLNSFGSYRQILSPQTQHHFEVNDPQLPQEDFSLSPNLKGQYYFTPKGQLFLFLLKLPVDVQSKFVDSQLILQIGIKPASIFNQNHFSEFEEYSYITDQHYEETFDPIRFATLPITVIQPFSTMIHRNVVENGTVIGIVVENNQTISNFSIYIQDLKFLMNDVVNKTEELFIISAPKYNLPCRLNGKEKQGFVVHVQPLFSSLNSLIPDSIHSQIIFIWTADCINGTIRSVFDLDVFVPILDELLLTIEVKNPVYSNVLFPVHFTLTNIGSQARDLILLLPIRTVDILPILDNENRFQIQKPSIAITNPFEETRGTSSFRYSVDQESKAETESIKSTNDNSQEKFDIPPQDLLKISRAPSIDKESIATPKESSKESSTPKEGETFDNLMDYRDDVSDLSWSEKSSEIDVDEKSENMFVGDANIASPLLLKDEEKNQKQKEEELLPPPFISQDKTIHLGIVQPLSDVSAHSLFLAAREGVFEFDKVQVFDRISHAIYNIQSSSKLRIYVTSQTLEEEKQKRKSEN